MSARVGVGSGDGDGSGGSAGSGGVPGGGEPAVADRAPLVRFGSDLAAGADGATVGARLPYIPFSLPFPAGFYAFAMLVAIIDTAFPIVWGVCWLLLGKGFLQGGGQASEEQPTLGLAA